MNKGGQKTWPLEARYGLRGFMLLAALELALAAGGHMFLAPGQVQVLILTLLARLLDLALIAYLLKRKNLGLEAVGLGRGLWKKGLAHGLAWGALAFAGVTAVYGWFLTPTAIRAGFAPFLEPTGLLALFTGVLFGPAVEEVVFRGWLYGALRNRWSWGPSAVITSLIFAFSHGLEPHRVVLALAGGMFFCLTYEKSRSLLTPVVLHLGGNALLRVWGSML